MSLYDAMFSGVAGLSSQSNAMSAISDNIANVNTVGYKGTSVSFSTLVTPQSSVTNASGSVQSRPRSGVDIQGMLQSTSSTTDISVLGEGFFVVSSNPNPTSLTGQFSYTRAGSFKTDSSGFLQNSAGYYLQGWPLVPSDGSAASVPGQMVVDSNTYMRAYRNADGTYHYVDQSSVNSSSLKPLNINDIGGTAEATSTLTMSANLPAADPAYSSANPTAGGKHSTDVPLYDSLGNSLNSTMTWTKVGANAWNLGVSPPTGAAVVNTVNHTSSGDYVYGSQGQIEFTRIPTVGESITLNSVNSTGTKYPVKLQFFNSASGSNNPTSDSSSPPVLGIDLNGTTDIASVVSKLQSTVTSAANAPMATSPTKANIAYALLGGTGDGASRFGVSGKTLTLIQEPGAMQLDVDCSNCASTVQSGTNQGSINAGSLTKTSLGKFTLPPVWSGGAPTAPASYSQSKAGSLSFSINNLPTGTSANLQIGKYQVPWSQVEAGQITSVTDISTGTTTTLTTAMTLPSGTLGGTASDKFTVPAAPTGNFTLGNVQIPWSQVTGGTISSFVNTTTGATVSLAAPVTVGGATATLYATALTNALHDANVAAQLTGVTITNPSAGVVQIATAAGTSVSADSGNSSAPFGCGSTPETIGNTGSMTVSLAAENAAYALNQLLTSPGTYGAPTLTDLSGTALSTSAFTVASSGSTVTVTAGSATTPQIPIIANNGGTSTDISWSGNAGNGTNGQILGAIGSYDSSNGSAITFNGDGTPAALTPNAMQINWANGAENQTGSSNTSGIKSQVTLNLGAANQTSGITQYSGSYTVNSQSRNGAKFGSYSGVSIGSDGVVTALFDNGVRRPVFQIPIATFPNPNGMTSLSGNVWVESASSGSFTLRSGGEGGAGKVQASQLESSTVDLSSEFTNMITVQRAYSASAKIITTADQMLDDLINLKR